MQMLCKTFNVFSIIDVELSELNSKNHLFWQLQPGELIWVLMSQSKHIFYLSICKVSIIIILFSTSLYCLLLCQSHPAWEQLNRQVPFKQVYPDGQINGVNSSWENTVDSCRKAADK